MSNLKSETNKYFRLNNVSLNREKALYFRFSDQAKETKGDCNSFSTRIDNLTENVTNKRKINRRPTLKLKSKSMWGQKKNYV